MDPSAFINILFVVAGTVIMAVAIRSGVRLKRTVPQEFSRWWTVITLLMLFFFFGYCGFAVLLFLKQDRFLELIISLIFLAGSIYVLLVINLSRRTIGQLVTGKKAMDAAHADLVIKTAQLEREIDKQILTERELREAKSILENVLNSAIPICITGIDFRIINANDAYFKTFNGQRAVRQGTLCFESRPGSACNTDQCPMRQIKEGKDEVVTECTKIDENGKFHHYILTARPFRNAAGELTGIVESFQDISHRKSAENLLAMEKERLAITLRSIGDGVITTDLKGNILMLNRVAETLCDWPLNEALGKPLDEVYYVVDFTTRKRIANPVQKVINTGKPVNITPGAVLIARDGWERFIADSAAPILDQKGNLFGVVLVFRDISEKRLMESEISKLEKLKAVGQLAGGIAHDFNNLLTAILGNISLARLSAGPESAISEKLVRAEDAVMKAKGLTQQLLTFAKGGAPLKKLINLDHLLRETGEFVLRGANSLIGFDISKDLWQVMADSDQLSQVVNNLVINADQSMPDGGVITLSAENFEYPGGDSLPLEKGAYVRISCRDEGCGIPEEHLPFVFDPYFTTKKTGSGLGLSTTYSIIRRHGGYITVSSKENEGTTITFYLPAVKEISAKDEASSSTLTRGTGRVLVMDDDTAILDTLKQMLTFLGYTPTLTVNGQDALSTYQTALLDGNPFACVILDLTIPGGMGGKETQKRLAALDPNVKAIVSSGYSSDPVVANFREYGFSAAVNKPYRLDELSQTLHRLLSEKTSLP